MQHFGKVGLFAETTPRQMDLMFERCRITRDILLGPLASFGLPYVLRGDSSERTISSAASKLSPTLTLQWIGTADSDSESFDDLEAAKTRARDLIGDDGLAEEASISDSEDRIVAAFVRLARADDLSKRRG
jgi:hypothetical protein